MKTRSARFRAGLLFASLLLALQLSANSDDSLSTRYITMAIQGDLSGAAAFFAETALPGQAPIGALHQAYEQRFVQTTGNLPGTGKGAFVDGVVLAYRNYWKNALLDPPGRPAYEAALERSLSGLLKDKQQGSESRYPDLGSALQAEGLRYLESPDPPLRDLFLWQTQDDQLFQVQLTDQKLQLKVHFLDGFLLQGWKEFASLGLTTTTGWVEGDELYCLGWAYDRNSENFEVSYLKHEARHLLDLERYPEMESTELEYRAKLTELAFASRTLKRILQDFTDKAALNPESPHAMANWRVIRDVYWELFQEEMPDQFEGWGAVRTGKVNRVARDLLTANSRIHGAR